MGLGGYALIVFADDLKINPFAAVLPPNRDPLQAKFASPDGNCASAKVGAGRRAAGSLRINLRRGGHADSGSRCAAIVVKFNPGKCPVGLKTLKSVENSRKFVPLLPRLL